MPRRGRGRGGGRSRLVRRSRNFVTPAQLRRDNQGFYPRGRFDPPRIVVTPWNNIVLAALSTANAAGTYDFQVANIVTLFRNQVGAPTALNFIFRVLRVDVWTTPGDVLQNTALNFGLRPASLLGPVEDDDFFPWVEDFGTATRPAHCHFVWPVAHQNCILVSNESTNIVIFSIDTPVVQSFSVHIHLMWRIAGGDPTPSYNLRLESTRRNPSSHTLPSRSNSFEDLEDTVSRLSLECHELLERRFL